MGSEHAAASTGPEPRPDAPTPFVLGPLRLTSLEWQSEVDRVALPVLARGEVCVVLQMYGRLTVSQVDSAVLLRPGYLTVIDGSRPFRTVATVPSASYAVVTSRNALGLSDDQLARAAARSFATRRGLGAIVADHLANLWREAPAVSAATAGDLARSTIDLIRLVVTEGLALEEDSASTDLFDRIVEFIDANLPDQRLSLEYVARRMNVSSRHVQRLFGRRDVALSTWTRDARLDRVRIDLDDPRLAGMTVSEIAERWGLTNPAHFSRAFKARFGCPPRDYRAARIGSAGDRLTVR
jgi:AraC-like DNA-binding protein